MQHAGHNPALSDLRRRIVSLDRSARAKRGALAFEVEALDKHLPWGGLPLGTLHEFAEGGLEAEHVAAATLFIGGCLARTRGTILWCLRGRDLFAPALAGVGLHPDRVIYVETWKDAEVLPAMEEALRHGGLGGVVGEVAHLSLVASRRLQLAAESSGVPAFALRRWRNDAERASACEPNAAFTRWHIRPAPSPAPAIPGLARARWQVELSAAAAPSRIPGFSRLAMPRVVSLFLPTFPTDRIARLVLPSRERRRRTSPPLRGRR